MVAIDPRAEWLQRHVADALAAERSALVLVRSHREDELAAAPDTAAALLRAERSLAQHVAVLEHYLVGIGGHATGTFRRAAQRAWAGLTRLRAIDVSRFLCDVSAALGSCAASSRMLHATALAHRDRHLAEIALTHLHAHAAGIRELAHLIPRVAAHAATIHEGAPIDVADEAEANTADS